MSCLLVKEGEYPPVEAAEAKGSKGLAGLKTFFRESFSCRFYWYRFLATSCAAFGGGVGMFGVFFNLQMGLSLEQIGKSVAISHVVMMFAIFVMASFVDRWHPLRLTTYSAVFGMFGSLSAGVWLFVTLPGNYYFWIGLVEALSGTMLAALWVVSMLPTEMRIFPRSRFGQFCSAQALLKSTCGAVAGILGGCFVDLLKWCCHGSDFAYRLTFLWSAVFGAASAVFTILVYREWHRLGGDRHFHPPAPWSPQGFEEMPITPTVGPQTRWLKIAFYFFDAVLVLPVISTPLLMWWMREHQAEFAFKWYGLIVLPLSILAFACWLFLKRAIFRDMAAAREGRGLRNGIPHHGMLLLVGLKYLVFFGVWIAEVVITTSMKMETGMLAFGIGRVFGNFAVIGAIWMLCRVERGYSNQVDVQWSTASQTTESAQTNVKHLN